LHLEPLHPAPLVASAIARAEARSAAREVRIRARLAPELPCLHGDARRLGAVLDNVLSNALKYSPAGGTVTVEVAPLRAESARRRSAISISVTDEGPGVPSAYRARIFEKFFRVPQPEAATRDRGAGIGLYLCRQIVDLHGGWIACASGPGDRGTRITLELPLEPTAAPAAPSSDGLLDAGNPGTLNEPALP
jgi:signal transduction histidine kinase